MEGREYMGDMSVVIVYVLHRVCCFVEHLLRNLENGTVMSVFLIW